MYKFQSIIFAVLGLFLVVAFCIDPALGIVTLILTVGFYIWSVKSTAELRALQQGSRRELEISSLIPQDIDPATASFSRGKFRYQTENYQLAIEDFNTAIDLNNRYIEAIYYRGLAWKKLADLELARIDLQYALSLCDADINRDLYRQIERQLKTMVSVEEDSSNDLNNASTSA
jgi:tetratricopeptide (TPR) repeat protein